MAWGKLSSVILVFGLLVVASLLVAFGVVARPVEQLGDPVTVSLEPAVWTGHPGDIFRVDIAIQSAQQPVDSAQVSIEFDATALGVVDEEGNPATAIIPGLDLPDMLTNTVVISGDMGYIKYGAGKMAGSPIQRDFTLASIYFKAFPVTQTLETSATFITQDLFVTKVSCEGSPYPLHIEHGRYTIMPYVCYLPITMNLWPIQ